jgi:alkylation response protein AidB-like acyl-CoA dehydrogenase
MDLSLSEQEQQLKDSVLSFVEREATTTVLVDLQESETGFEQKWLASMADAGWLGALVSPEFGGVGANALEAALICEALGSGPVPGPFLASSVVSAALLGAADPSAGRDATLAAIAEGHAVVVPACTVPGRSWDGLKTGLPAESSGDAVTLSHTLSYVPYAAGASHVLVPLEGSPTDRRRFALVATDLPGVTSRLLPGFLARNYEVSLDQVAVGEDALLTIGSPESLRDALALAYILVAAYQVGGCSSLLDRSVAYSNTRVQFGMPVGRFQRVQDHIVELLNALDAARWCTYEAIWRFDSGQASDSSSHVASAHLARSLASDGYISCADYAHKVHGGIGVDPQYGLTLFTQMSRSLFHFMGDPQWHRRQMVAALGWSSGS